jgi:hypothetical protein
VKCVLVALAIAAPPAGSVAAGVPATASSAATNTAPARISRSLSATPNASNAAADVPLRDVP